MDQSHLLPMDMTGLSCKSLTMVGVVSKEGVVSAASSSASCCMSWMYFAFKCFKYDLHHKNELNIDSHILVTVMIACIHLEANYIV